MPRVRPVLPTTRDQSWMALLVAIRQATGETNSLYLVDLALICIASRWLRQPKQRHLASLLSTRAVTTVPLDKASIAELRAEVVRAWKLLPHATTKSMAQYAAAPVPKRRANPRTSPVLAGPPPTFLEARRQRLAVIAARSNKQGSSTQR